MSRVATLTRLAGACAVVAVVTVALRAEAALHEVSVGNYYFQHDATGARDPLVVQQGDQIRFTVREQTYPNHSVNVDELGIRSGDMVLFETYTTPPLNRPGTYRLYCRAHTDRGHITRLVVRATPATTTTGPRPTSTTARPGGPTMTSTSTSTSTSTTPGAATETTPPPSATAPPAADAPPDTLAPVGRGTATDRRQAPPEPGSLAAILGRRPAEPGPWTRAVRLGAATTALVLLVAVAALAYGYRPRS